MVAGCSTGYHRQGFSGEYTDMCIQDDVYQVFFNGNGYTSSQKAADFALLRCAEITLEKSCKYFSVLNENSGSETSLYTTPATTYHSGSVNMYGNSNYASGSYSGYSQTTGGQTYSFSKPSTQYMIQMLKEKQSDRFCYDAQQVYDNIRTNYKLNTVKKQTLRESGVINR